MHDYSSLLSLCIFSSLAVHGSGATIPFHHTVLLKLYHTFLKGIITLIFTL